MRKHMQVMGGRGVVTGSRLGGGKGVTGCQEGLSRSIYGVNWGSPGYGPYLISNSRGNRIFALL